MNNLKFEIGLGVFAILILATAIVISCWKSKNQREECNKVGATVVNMHRSYLCVKDGLIIDKDTGKVVGVRNEDNI